MRGNIGQVVEVSGGSELCLSMLAECAGIAKAAGFPQSAAFLEQQKVALTARGSSMSSSMYRDLRHGLPVEADAIVGDLLRRGKQHENVSTAGFGE
jgi:2-dehydropantoate 2-reductase